MSKHLDFFCHPTSHRSLRKAGFTLVEVLVATAVTLLMMVALARIFSDIGKSMKQGRAALQLNSQLRDVAFRIRRDLNNLTANPNELPGTSTGRGYLEYYEGPQADYSTQLLGTPMSNRIGDVDDILMFTARAGDVWFTGKVPSFVLSGTVPTAADSDSNGLIDALENPISVASQHAEIVMWCEPVVASTSFGIPFVDSNGNPFTNVQRDPSYLIANQAFYDDKNSDLVPDSYRLHYRTLIVRPDLNLASGILPNSGLIFTAGPNTVSSGTGGTLPQTPPVEFDLPFPACDMFRIHAACDLSVRRVYDGSPMTRDAVAANSLEDLENPANRFAHFQPALPGTNSTTGPVLALGPSIPMLSPTNAQLPLTFDFSATNAPVTGAGIVGSGFLHPAFTLFGRRAGEDVLANNILAFDIKGFDPAVPLRASSGIDAAPGAAGYDDDGNGMTDDVSEFGWAGSDDMVLSPNDPGYGNALGNTIVGYGDYVDLDWGRKLIRHGATITAASNVWSPLSGLTQSGTTFGVSPSLRSSSKVVNTAGGAILVDQPTYDTWTPLFESDGIVQGNLTSGTGLMFAAGTSIRVNGARALYNSGLNSDMGRVRPLHRANYPDAFGDGLDNNGTLGADDISERETSPPYATPLRGLKISIRMEDPGSRQVRELPVAVEFVTQ